MNTPTEAYEAGKATGRNAWKAGNLGAIREALALVTRTEADRPGLAFVRGTLMGAAQTIDPATRDLGTAVREMREMLNDLDAED